MKRVLYKGVEFNVAKDYDLKPGMVVVAEDSLKSVQEKLKIMKATKEIKEKVETLVEEAPKINFSKKNKAFIIDVIKKTGSKVKVSDEMLKTELIEIAQSLGL